MCKGNEALWASAEGHHTRTFRHPARICTLLAETICSLVLALVFAPGARAQQDVPTYTSTPQILSILGSSWMGSGFDDSGDAHYLLRPGKDMTGTPGLCVFSVGHAVSYSCKVILPCSCPTITYMHPREQSKTVHHGQGDRQSVLWKC